MSGAEGGEDVPPALTPRSQHLPASRTVLPYRPLGQMRRHCRADAAQRPPSLPRARLRHRAPLSRTHPPAPPCAAASPRFAGWAPLSQTSFILRCHMARAQGAHRPDDRTRFHAIVIPRKVYLAPSDRLPSHSIALPRRRAAAPTYPISLRPCCSAPRRAPRKPRSVNPRKYKSAVGAASEFGICNPLSMYSKFLVPTCRFKHAIRHRPRCGAY